MCRESDILKLMRKKEERNYIAKENSRLNIIFKIPDWMISNLPGFDTNFLLQVMM